VLSDGGGTVAARVERRRVVCAFASGLPGWTLSCCYVTRLVWGRVVFRRGERGLLFLPRLFLQSRSGEELFGSAVRKCEAGLSGLDGVIVEDVLFFLRLDFPLDGNDVRV
jgi:hypothetical protein